MRSLSFLFAALLFSTASFAKIWRVNNNQGITANFTTLQAAHDGAASGDTIYVEASPNSYGGLSCSKKLYILGAGFFLDQNLNLQANGAVSWIGTVYFYNGSAGSIIEGMWFNGSSVSIQTSNIIVRRNFFGQWNGSSPDWYTGNIGINTYVSNILITQNYGVNITNGYTSNGILITNNLIASPLAYGDNNANASNCLQLVSSTVAIVKNNIFRRGRLETYNCNLSNNIMYFGSFVGTGNLTSNNIASGTQFGTTNGNQANISMSTVFELTGSTDAQWKLKAGSPAIGAGYGSTQQNPVDCGMFGGNTPYVLSGIPPVPSIYYFANQPVGSNSDPIDVQIKVRSNN